MSDLILPPSCRPNRTNVQMTDNICVLVHKDTKIPLCFAYKDAFTKKLADRIGFQVIEISHAHEFDKWAKQLNARAQEQNEQEEYERLQREQPVRDRLRAELRSRLNVLTEGPQRMAVESALKCLDVLEARRKRYHESFFVREGFEESKADVGEVMTKKLMVGK